MKVDDSSNIDAETTQISQVSTSNPDVIKPSDLLNEESDEEVDENEDVSYKLFDILFS